MNNKLYINKGTQTEPPTTPIIVISTKTDKATGSSLNLIKKKRKRIQNPQIDSYTDDELAYYQSIEQNERELISNLETSLSVLNQNKVPLRFKILNSSVDEKIKAIAIQKLNYLYNLDESCSEYYRTVTWIENVCKIPFNQYKTLPVDYNSPITEIRRFMSKIRDNLEEKVYGHTEAKDHIIRLLGQWIANPLAKGMVIGIHGPHGCGKTTLVKDGICEVLGLPFAFIPLGGANDGCYLDGHSYTYEGATWGKIVDILMKTQVMNPVLFFDELDKVSETTRGQEIINKLIHLTDASQNDKISDKYFSDFEFDLSRSLIIFSYNDAFKINPVLKDRMICVNTKGYNVPDKIQICEKHMIPLLLKEYNFQKEDIVFEKSILKTIINVIENEGGVRNLKRALQEIVSNINLKNLIDDNLTTKIEFPYHVTQDDVQKYVSKKSSEHYTHLMYS